MKMKDRYLLCQDCGDEFRFPIRERKFYKQNGFQEPCHCRVCRDARRRDLLLAERRMKRNGWY